MFVLRNRLTSWSWTRHILSTSVGKSSTCEGPVAFRRLFGSSSLHDAAEVTGNKSQSDDVEVIRSDSSIIPPMPDENSSRRWAGMKYEELPIVHIKASYNNTIIQVVYADGKAAALTSCGVEGFKNAKKTSVVAAQTTGLSAGTKASKKNITHVRVVFKGIGPGRFPALRGLVTSGLQVVSLTDDTPLPHNGCRPRKVRRI
uniref:small ribosomal subunit protein uS11m isoform X2 n=1 Tax=Myxine glutinosa TaxID=7769 RepID=UPI00358F6611